MAQCLNKDPELRASSDKLLEHPFLRNAEKHREEFKQFIVFWKEKDRL